MLFLFGIFIVGSVFYGTAALNCPPHYTDQHGDSCYFYSTQGDTWMGALVACQMIHGHLVEIETQEEFNYLKQLDKRHSNSDQFYWTGLSSRVISNIWIWATSHNEYDSREFNMWATGEPDHLNGDTEKCVGMDNFANSNHHYELADLNCNEGRNYICESIPFPDPAAVGK